jgi:hypothetical protein
MYTHTYKQTHTHSAIHSKSWYGYQNQKYQKPSRDSWLHFIWFLIFVIFIFSTLKTVRFQIFVVYGWISVCMYVCVSGNVFFYFIWNCCFAGSWKKARISMAKQRRQRVLYWYGANCKNVLLPLLCLLKFNRILCTLVCLCATGTSAPSLESAPPANAVSTLC